MTLWRLNIVITDVDSDEVIAFFVELLSDSTGFLLEFLDGAVGEDLLHLLSGVI